MEQEVVQCVPICYGRNLTARALGQRAHDVLARNADHFIAFSHRIAHSLTGDMPRRDIGDYLGLALETVSRALSQLSDQGILVFSSARQIVLHYRQRLADMDA